MARADTPTLLSLDVFARILGLNPLHFNGARLPETAASGMEPYTTMLPYTTQQQPNSGLNHRPLWKQYEWQGSAPSRETMAQEIAIAEREVADFLGYWPAPTWISQEVHKYPTPYRNEYFGSGRDVRWQFKGVKTKYAKVIQAGRRATTLIDTATTAGGTLVYSDPDGLGWDSLATITVPTTLTNECEIKLYFVNKSGNPAWEIRPLRSVSIAGGFVTITADSWLLFDQDVVNAVPQSEITAINADEPTNYVTSVEVRREYTDFTQASAQLIWQREPREVWPNYICTTCGGSGCEACSMVSQDACFTIKDADNGFVGPVIAASYDDTDERWESASPTIGREPDQVKLWYYCGDYSQPWLRGETCDPLDPVIARAIALMAVSRITGDFRSFSPLNDIVEYWRRDMLESWPDGSTIFVPPQLQVSPFGTKRGEIRAYNMLGKLRERKLKVAAVAA